MLAGAAAACRSRRVQQMDRSSAQARRRVFAVIAAATIQNLPFGTLYAFSVFLSRWRR